MLLYMSAEKNFKNANVSSEADKRELEKHVTKLAVAANIVDALRPGPLDSVDDHVNWLSAVTDIQAQIEGLLHPNRQELSPYASNIV
jgi:hypothetical protein